MEESQHIKIVGSAFPVLIGDPSITDVDWNNPDVIRLFEHMKSRMEAVERENLHMKSRMEAVERENEQLKALLGQQQQQTATGSGSAASPAPKEARKNPNSRGYNVRKFHDFPHPEKPAPKRKLKTKHAATCTATADAKFCPGCGDKLSDWSEAYPKESEDLIDGRWTKTDWNVIRRYCKSCKKRQTAPVPGVLPREHYGTRIIGIIAFLRCMCISFERIQIILHTLHGAYIPTSTIIRLCDVSATRMKPVYDGILEEIRHSESVAGDETGWFLNGTGHWVWVLVTKFSAFYHIAPSRSGDVIDSLMAAFDGIVSSDSYSAWNRIGGKHQKCLLHYFRDMYLTLEKNPGAEYGTLFCRLRDILKDAIEMGRATPEEVECLKHRIHRLASAAYTDRDCIRYTKRLKREINDLFTFLEHDGVKYHNNDSERALRMIAVIRKILFGNRSEKGMRMTETLCTVYATCELRGVNFCTFVTDYLDGRVTEIPMPAEQCVGAIAAAT